ncbi:hypothetical protein [Salipaludibacillus daqingensis]|uniref:hypothetical protein n=1 Tax=Salipaludibacillus daqingensis TaxID=3041001 RepID=UPI002475D6E8|nr:hypothetical protein [Salipaludibacillus daqingensis]
MKKRNKGLLSVAIAGGLVAGIGLGSNALFQAQETVEGTASASEFVMEMGAYESHSLTNIKPGTSGLFEVSASRAGVSSDLDVELDFNLKVDGHDLGSSARTNYGPFTLQWYETTGDSLEKMSNDELQSNLFTSDVHHERTFAVGYEWKAGNKDDVDNNVKMTENYQGKDLDFEIEILASQVVAEEFVTSAILASNGDRERFNDVRIVIKGESATAYFPGGEEFTGSLVDGNKDNIRIEGSDHNNFVDFRDLR